MKAVVYLGLGGNQGRVKHAIQRSISLLNRLPLTQVKSVSSMYQNPAMGSQAQPDYINAVCQIHTSIPPLQLLRFTQKIESTLGRRRKGKRWSSRPMDVDILLYGSKIVNKPNLCIPHYGITDRAFVLLPLVELDAKLRMPNGDKLKKVLRKIDSNQMKRVDQWRT